MRRKTRRYPAHTLCRARQAADGSRTDAGLKLDEQCGLDITLFGEEIAAELNRVIDGQPLGFVVAGDRRQPLTEIELKAGEEIALYDLAVRLAE